jgi:hypothetical protein
LMWEALIRRRVAVDKKTIIWPVRTEFVHPLLPLAKLIVIFYTRRRKS